MEMAKNGEANIINIGETLNPGKILPFLNFTFNNVFYIYRE